MGVRLFYKRLGACAAVFVGLGLVMELSRPPTVAWAAKPMTATASTIPTESPPKNVRIDFVRDVSPIFAAHCLRCHGEELQEGGLRLDRPAAALTGGDAGAVIVRGKSGESPLLRRVSSHDPDERMPPIVAGRALSQDEVTRLRRWIDAGAAWPEGMAGKNLAAQHWAFQPVVRPAPPSVAQKSRVRTPVDSFVLERLESEQIAPSPEADAATLARRLYLDLTGLPPAAEEAEEFVAAYAPAGNREAAYGALVEKLLASPHFGERWGRHWLDLARYGDSNGYELDIVRPNAWRYRDWVIEAINADMPFDRFIVEQLAGDLPADGGLAPRTATGFHRMTIKNTESGINQEDYRNREMVDRVNTTASAVLGVTLGCAQCHNHKYDPFTIEEYYQFYAFFNNLEETEIDLPGTAAERREYDRSVGEHFDKWLGLQAQQRLVAELLKQGPEQSARALDNAADKARKQLAAQRQLADIGLDPFFQQAPPETQKALEAPSTVSSFLKPDKKADKKKFEKTVERYLASLPRINSSLQRTLDSAVGYADYLGETPELCAALRAEATARSADQKQRVAGYYALLPAKQDEIKQNLRLLVTEERYLPAPQLLVVRENRAAPRKTHVFLRGDFKAAGAEVEPGVPAVLPPLISRGTRPDRLDLGRWLVSAKNPLTPRVAVNHIWARLFGRGLVATVDDFGIRGEKPSHPELLDWLADEFVRNGMRRKPLIRTIVTSSAYRQASAFRDDLVRRDPQNTLVARQGRFRVEAEIVRDLFLASSGLLDRRVGGPSVYPAIPDAVRDIAYKYQLIWPTSAAPDCYRRGMYVHFRRSNPYPSLTVFDAPDGTMCAAERNRSNTPLQALTTLNDPVFMENARELAGRLVAEGPSDDDGRVRRLFAACLARAPEPAELRILRELVESERAAYRSDPRQAAELVGPAAAGSPAADGPVAAARLAERAAWTAAARAVLNLDEFVTRE